jgi:hypothetical protein
MSAAELARKPDVPTNLDVSTHLDVPTSRATGSLNREHAITGDTAITPAMAAGVTDRVWEIADIVALFDSSKLQHLAARREERTIRSLTNKGPALGL